MTACPVPTLQNSTVTLYEQVSLVKNKFQIMAN